MAIYDVHGNVLSESDIVVDNTLKKSGQAADAKVVGDRFDSLSEEIVTDVAEHNTGTDAHSDIRLLISGLTDRLNALADSDDTTLDQLSEVVAYIKSNRTLIEAITTSKVSVSDIIDNLVTNVANKPLSAAQGVALKALIDAISIPEKLPNPNALTFTGAVTGSYDGSAPIEVAIPSGGVDTVYNINATFSGDDGYIIPSSTGKTAYKCGRIVFINFVLRITAADETAWHVIVTDIPSPIDTNEHIMPFISRDGRGPCRIKVDGNSLVIAGGEASGSTAITWYDIQYVYISAD